MMRKTTFFAGYSLSALALLLSGCSTGVTGSTVPSTAVSAAYTGRVHGGAQPVSGATIQIYTVGTTGYGSAGTPLLTGVTTALDGSFSFSGLTCPSGPGGRDRLYLTATGGNPGFGGTVNNDALFLMTVIDSCQALTTSSFFSVNEVSTVASVYALAQFIDPTTGSIGSYGSSPVGIDNAFDLAVTLFNPATGSARTTTPYGNGLVPVAEINTLANIITPCVNSASSASVTCSALFPLTTGTASNTMLAALHIATHPGTNVAAISALAFANAPFQPALTSTPNDFTMAVSYHSGVGTPTGLAIDGFGNVWIADYQAGGSSAFLFKFTPQVVPAAGSPFNNGASMEYLAIDSNNAVWVVDPIDQRVSQFNNNGSPGFTFNLNASGVPQGIAIDSGNNPWVVNNGGLDEVSVANGGSLALSGGGLNYPIALAFDNSGNAWVANNNVGAPLSKFNASGLPVSASGYSGGGLNQPDTIAIDPSGNVYLGNNNGGVLSEFNSSGTPVSSSGYSSSTFGNLPQVAVDGGGHLWNVGANKLLSEFYAGALVSPSTGYQSPAVNQPSAMAIDPSGNLWVIDKTHILQNGTFVNLVNFVGLATPVNTPLVANVQNAQVGQRAGTPIPVSITNTALPYFTSGTAYAAKLMASGGNSGSYTWSTTSTLPGTLTLSSSGVLSGVPAGSAVPISFTVTDSALPSNTASRTITLSPATALPTGVNTAFITGPFAVLLKGFKGGSVPPGGAVSGFAALGSLVFDGAGNVTGQMDYNGPSGASLLLTIQGTYTVGTDLRGTILLNDTSGGLLPQQLAFSVANSYQTLYFTEFDYAGSAPYGLASGIGKLQTPAAFQTATLGQTFVYGLSGETPCSTCNGAVSPYGPLSAAGRLVNSAGATTGVQDGAGVNNTYSGVTLSGTYTAPDATYGRGSFSLTSTGTTFPAAPTGFIYYVVDANELLLLSSTTHAIASLLSGDALVQSATFSATPANNNGVFTGNYVVASASTTNNDGGVAYPSVTDNLLVLANSAGAGSASLLQDQNTAGLPQLEQSLGTTSYSIDGNGRMTFTGGPIALYLASAADGFGTQLPKTLANGGGNPGLITVQQQSGAPFDCNSLVGAFSFGNVAPSTVSSISSGVLTLTTGTASATADNSTTSGALLAGQTNTFTCSTDANTATLGRLMFADSSGKPNVGYIISPSQMILLNVTPNKTRETMTIVQAQ